MARRPPLTRRQKEVLTFVQEYCHLRGLAPTLQEIADHLGISRITAHEHVRQLVRKGYLTKEPHASRAIHPTGPASGEEPVRTRLPILGAIAAGQPIEAVADEEVLDLSGWFPPDRPYYVLRVKGTSMIEDHIQDGDYVVVDPTRPPRNGDTVVALLEGQEVTLKRFYREGDRIRLQPANPALAPIYTRDVTVQGVVVAVLRRV